MIIDEDEEDEDTIQNIKRDILKYVDYLGEFSDFGEFQTTFTIALHEVGKLADDDYKDLLLIALGELQREDKIDIDFLKEPTSIRRKIDKKEDFDV